MEDTNKTATSGNPTPEAGERTFTQDEVNRIIQERLAKEKAKYDSALQELQLQARTDRAKQRLKDADYYSLKGDLMEMVDLSGDEAMEKSFQMLEKFMPKKTEQTAAQKIAEMELNAALSNALTQARARNVKAVTALLNLDAVKMVDGNLVGLTEQLDAVRNENEYLFDPKPGTPMPRPVAPTGHSEPASPLNHIRVAMGLNRKE